MTTNTADAPSEDRPETVDESLIPEERHADADRLVRHYTLGGMAVGLVPVPVLDLAALVALQLKMLHSLATLYGVEFRADLGRSAIGSLIGGILPSALSPSLAASLAKIIPGAGQTLAAGSLVVLNGASTYALGKVFIQHFAAGGTFLTFDPEAVRDFFQEQLQEGRDVAASLRRKQAGPEQTSSNRAAAP